MHLHPSLIAHREDFQAALSLADAMRRFNAPLAWVAACAALHKVDAIRGFSKREQLAYLELARRRGLSALRDRVEAETRAGNVCAVFAAHSLDLPRAWPIAVWACPVEAGPDDRMDTGLLRAALWLGFDPDARDVDGRSAMDLMLGGAESARPAPLRAGLLAELRCTFQ